MVHDQPNLTCIESRRHVASSFLADPIMNAMGKRGQPLDNSTHSTHRSSTKLQGPFRRWGCSGSFGSRVGRTHCSRLAEHTPTTYIKRSFQTSSAELSTAFQTKMKHYCLRQVVWENGAPHTLTDPPVRSRRRWTPSAIACGLWCGVWGAARTIKFERSFVIDGFSEMGCPSQH
jgi:hypothetical protein